jgi:hypothetical protein
MNECCESQRSQYCPYCGANLRGNTPISQLLRHIEITIKMKTRERKTFQAHPRWSGDDEHLQEKRLRQMQKNIEKWQSWNVALRDLIKKDGEET